MQYLNTPEGLRSRGFPKKEVAVKRYEIKQKFNEGVRNNELKRHLALMYAQEQNAEAQPTVEALCFMVQQYLRICGSSLSKDYPTPLQQPQPASANHKRPCPHKRPMPRNHLNSLWLIGSHDSEHVSIEETRRTLSWVFR